jgi:hypothetical protein
MRKDEFIGQKFHWFTGEIVDIDDDQKFNRVRVYCHGYHDKKFKKENKESLPWAIVMMPTTSAGTPNVGANHHLEVGSWVVGFFRDGESAQDPIVMGSITSSTDGKSDLPELASTTNKIYRSKAGHIVEFDNTDGAERINIRHRTGSNFSIDSNGDTFVDSTASGGEIFIWSNSHITVNADEDIKVVSTGGKVDITAAGDITLKSATKTTII